MAAQLRLYNSLTRAKEPFAPLRPPQVGLYTCGPTVYNYQHVGNYRTYVFEDVLKRTLGFFGYKVNHVMNMMLPCWAKFMPQPDSAPAGAFHQRPCAFASGWLSVASRRITFASTPGVPMLLMR